MHRRAGVQRVADRELAGVDEADDVAGERFVDRLAIAAEEAVGARRADRLADAAVGHRHVLGEAARADADERHAIAMARIHVRLDLEDETGEALVGRADEARRRSARGCGGGASSTSARRNGSRPKLVSALPKNTGVCRPARYSATSNGVPAAPMTSSDSRKCA